MFELGIDESDSSHSQDEEKEHENDCRNGWLKEDAGSGSWIDEIQHFMGCYITIIWGDCPFVFLEI
jgi:hypothetical protein